LCQDRQIHSTGAAVAPDCLLRSSASLAPDDESNSHPRASPPDRQRGNGWTTPARSPSDRQKELLEYDHGESSGSAVDRVRRAAQPWPEYLDRKLSRFV